MTQDKNPSAGPVGDIGHAELQRLMDKDAIRELVAKYSLFIDLARYEKLPALFTEDAVLDYGPTLGGPHVGLAAFNDFNVKAQVMPAFRVTTHHNANLVIEFVDNDTAQGWAGLYAWHEAEDGSHAVVWGYYEDVYVRMSDGWRIRQRTMRIAGDQNFPFEWNRLPRG